ncbi:pteropsin1 [Daphnia pulex]|uniref:Pteropsin1 n=1 Tax=Daphnia pulex TaxID=6669 RepID=E9G0T7_DAPPU|nr:pteropsin1 [Daphnia pulex]|eukprot:EFX87345.1 pteropsin1 [Daphnia pulex]
MAFVNSSRGTILLIVLTSFLFCVTSESPEGRKSLDGYSYSRQEYYDMLVSVANYSEDSNSAGHRLLMPVWAYKSAAGYLLFISVMGLALNIIVVLVLLSDQQKMTPLNWMLLNLACCDGISAGFGAPISIAAAFHSGWPFSQELCAAYAMIISTAGIGSITTLSALAILRCKIVVQNHVYSANRFSAFTTRSVRLGCHKAALLLSLIWSYVLLVTCPPIFGWGQYDREPAHISCSVNWELQIGSNRSYIFYMFTFGLIVPTVVIFVCYSNILREVRKSEAAEKRSTVMVAVMIGAFLIAWTPYSILALTETFNGKHYGNSSISPVLATVPSLLAKTSSVLNPIIYGFLNTQFKLAWKKMALRFLRRHGQKLGKERSFTAGLTTTYITVKPSIIYHLPTKELTEGYQIHGIVNNVPPQHQLQPVKLIPGNKSPSLSAASPEEFSAGIKEQDQQQQQPVLLVVVRYVSSSIIHHLHPSAGNSGNWAIT